MEARKGELSDLEAQLKALAGRSGAARDVIEARRALFQKVLGYMTQGVDMSPLFGIVVQNAATNDVATKKMLYHYITANAHAKQDLALLTVNTLVKDCGDEDPTIRGLALRSLTGLRVPSLVEYLARPSPTRLHWKKLYIGDFFSELVALTQIGSVKNGLSDRHPYPRKTAALGVLKIMDYAPAAIERAELLPVLRILLMEDPSPEAGPPAPPRACAPRGGSGGSQRASPSQPARGRR